jgi:hypothetical protein
LLPDVDTNCPAFLLKKLIIGTDYIEFGPDVINRRSVPEILHTSGSGEELLSGLRREHPDFLLRSYNNIRAYIGDNFRVSVPPYVPAFALDTFRVPETLIRWAQENIGSGVVRPMSLVCGSFIVIILVKIFT